MRTSELDTHRPDVDLEILDFKVEKAITTTLTTLNLVGNMPEEDRIREGAEMDRFREASKMNMIQDSDVSLMIGAGRS